MWIPVFEDEASFRRSVLFPMEIVKIKQPGQLMDFLPAMNRQNKNKVSYSIPPRGVPVASAHYQEVYGGGNVHFRPKFFVPEEQSGLTDGYETLTYRECRKHPGIVRHAFSCYKSRKLVDRAGRSCLAKKVNHSHARARDWR